jgi:hypothetical protein
MRTACAQGWARVLSLGGELVTMVYPVDANYHLAAAASDSAAAFAAAAVRFTSRHAHSMGARLGQIAVIRRRASHNGVSRRLQQRRQHWATMASNARALQAAAAACRYVPFLWLDFLLVWSWMLIMIVSVSRPRDVAMVTHGRSRCRGPLMFGASSMIGMLTCTGAVYVTMVYPVNSSRDANTGPPWPVTPELYKQLLPPAGTSCTKVSVRCLLIMPFLLTSTSTMVYPVDSRRDFNHKPPWLVTPQLYKCCCCCGCRV